MISFRLIFSWIRSAGSSLYQVQLEIEINVKISQIFLKFCKILETQAVEAIILKVEKFVQGEHHYRDLLREGGPEWGPHVQGE